MLGFTSANVPNQTGKTFFITGANSGLGFEAAKTLAGKGARVLIGCRSMTKANSARDKILAEHSSADVELVELDLSSLDSIRRAAQIVNAEERLDVLINNAGIMVPPLEHTADGFESQFGVNHLGPFALTSLLLDKLRATTGARIVSTSSIAHKRAEMSFQDINAQESYNALERYGQSKLANLYFAYELQRRLEAAGDKTLSVAAHPGIADTELMRYLPRKLMLFAPLFRPILNTAESGSWPTLCAATQEGVSGGDYYGPGKRRQTAGPAVKVRSSSLSHDEGVAKQLWDLSIKMTGIDPKI